MTKNITTKKSKSTRTKKSADQSARLPDCGTSIGPFSDKDVRPELNELFAEEVRLFMAKRGWSSRDLLTSTGWKEGGLGYTIWFDRWDWAGRRWGQICYFAAKGGFDKLDAESVQKEMAAVTRLAAEICLRVEAAFPSDVPNNMDRFGKIGEHWLWRQKKAEEAAPKVKRREGKSAKKNSKKAGRARD